MTIKTLACAAVVLIATTGSSLACKGKNVLFEDNFAEADPAWDVFSDTKIEDGAMKITAPAGRIAPVLYKADVYDKADICVDAIVPKIDDPQKNMGSAALLFEAESDNFYAFYVYPAYGTVTVARLFKHKWLYPVPVRKADGINSEPGAKNTLRVTLNGARATAYVNDHKIADFRINASEGGGFVGLNVDGGETSPVTWSFKNFKVTDVP